MDDMSGAIALKSKRFERKLWARDDLIGRGSVDSLTKFIAI